MESKKKNWLDFSPYGAEAVVLRVLNNRSFFIINGLDPNSAEYGALLNLKTSGGVPYFSSRGEGGYLFTGALTVPLREVFSLLPRCIPTETPPRSIFNDASIRDDADLQQRLTNGAESLGTNYEGDQVFRTPFMKILKRVSPSGLDQYMYEDQINDPGAFFSVAFGTPLETTHLDQCARGLIRAASEGRKLRDQDLAKVVAAIYGDSTENIKPATDKRAIDLLKRCGRILKEEGFSKPWSERSYESDVKVYEYLPDVFVETGFTVTRQPSDLPPPLLSAIRSIMPKDKSLGVSLVASDSPTLAFLSKDFPASSFMSPFQSVLDEARRINKAVSVERTVGFSAEFTEQPDVVVVNLTPQKDPTGYEHEDFRTARRDFALAYKTLLDRKPGGLGFLALSNLEDSAGSRASLVKAEDNAKSREFLEFIGKRFEIVSAVNIHQNLIEKEGPSYTPQLIVVGKKRPEPLSSFNPLTDIEVKGFSTLRSWDEIGQWSSTARQAVAQSKLIENLVAARDAGLRVMLQEQAKDLIPLVEERVQQQVGMTTPVIPEPEQEGLGATVGTYQLATFAEDEQKVEKIAQVDAEDTPPANEVTDATNTEPSQNQPKIGKRLQKRIEQLISEGKSPSEIEVELNIPFSSFELAPVAEISTQDEDRLVIVEEESDAEVVIDVFARNRERLLKEFAEVSFEDALGSFELDEDLKAYVEGLSFNAVYERVFEEDEALLDRGKKVDREDNRYQSPTRTLSKLREPSSMTPRNLVASMTYAQDKLQRKVKDIDRFVSTKLRMTISEMVEVFSPEQVDAIGQWIVNSDQGKGVLIADQTGIGKGRIIAAIARYAHFQNKPFMFVTEGSHLFSDFYRDLRDIKSDHLFKEIMILNSDKRADICDDITGELIFKRNPATVARVLSAAEQGEGSLVQNGIQLCFATYSQFRTRDSVKSKWMRDQACEGAFLSLDESHNAASSSANCNEVIDGALGMSDRAVHSSATFAKNARTMSTYRTVFPAGMDSEEIRDILVEGGEPMAEIISSMLAQDGCLIRREHDLSRLTFRTVVDHEHLERNIELADRFAEILLEINKVSAGMRKMSAKVNDRYMREHLELPEHLKKGGATAIDSMGFGSSMYALQRMFALCLKADFVAERAIETLRNGQKPVIVIEQTQESMLRMSMKAYLHALQSEDLPSEYLYQDIFDEDGNEIVSDSPLDFEEGFRMPAVTMRNALMHAFKQTASVKRKAADGTVERIAFLDLAIEDPKSTAEDIQMIRDWTEKVQYLISDFPDLSLAPIDYVRTKIEAAGFTFGEVSGRKFQLDFESQKDKVPNIVVRHRKDDRKKAVRDFNSGEVDSLLINIAGASGISVHSNRKFRNTDQRVMIEWQIANDVNKRVQLFGRVNRNGQVVDPIIETVSTGLPFEMRLISMQMQKLRELSANTQANRRNAVEETQTLDLINKVGNESAREFLMSNPDIANLLCIDMEEMSRKLDNTAYINRLTFMVGLLYVDEQIDVLQKLEADFKSRLRDKEALGENPLRVKEYDWRATVVQTTLFSGVERESYDSAFDRPVYLTKLSYQEAVNPMRWDGVHAMVTRSRAAIAKKYGDDKFSETRLHAVRKAAVEAYRAHMRQSLSTRLRPADLNMSDEEAVNAHIETLVNSGQADFMLGSYHSRMVFLNENLMKVLPGSLIEIDHGMGMKTRGVVTELFTPNPGHESFLSHYEFSLATPGSKGAFKKNLASIFSMNSEITLVDHLDPSHPAWSPETVFQQQPSGILERERLVLTGNLFEAIKASAGRSLGSPGVYTDVNGVRHAAIVLSPSATMGDLRNIPIPVEMDAVRPILREVEFSRVCIENQECKDLFFSISVEPRLRSDDPTVETRRLFIDFTSSKKKGGWEDNAELMSILRDNNRKLSRMGAARSASVTVPMAELDRLVECLKKVKSTVTVTRGEREKVFGILADMREARSQMQLPKVA